MIEIEKKVFEYIIEKLISAKEIRDIVELLPRKKVFGLVLLDISKGTKSKNYAILSKIAKKNKISEQFIIDQAISAFL